ncbi:class I SAM-dependent methyltransferase [Aureivirga marina]|uniref:class I SAM-dependent methyltransferase n=1 Tax=Aureivirga marina TaxID=1182451 RepID=UPI0018CA1A74|nr:class I SAM-dependent methyltransferase [Aureivirga marina]
MSIKKHYDTHLAGFYSWMLGDFKQQKDAFKNFCLKHEILPKNLKNAIDLGAGNGIQSVALAEIGFDVVAVDFNRKLLGELEENKENLPIKIIQDDIRNLKQFDENSVELISCCGDTISHLESEEELENFIQSCYQILSKNGKLILSFRDYSIPLKNTDRFIPVKSDETKILTCVIDYFEKKILVTDLLHEKINGNWIQKVSSYEKLRLIPENVIELIETIGFSVKIKESLNRMIYLVLEK